MSFPLDLNRSTLRVYRSLAAYASALAFLSGCARFHPQPIDPGATAAALESRRLDGPEFRAFLNANLAQPPGSWPLASWDFKKLLLAAFYFHPSLDLARAQWQLAAAGKATAAERPNPTISAVPGYVVGPTEGLSPWFPALTLDFPVETAGKRGYRMAQARHLSEAARWNLIAVAWQVCSVVRLALIDLRAAEARTHLLQQQQSVQEKAIRALEQQLQAGAISSSELTLVRIALNQIQLDLYTAQEQSADARSRLAEAIGIPTQALDNIQPDYELARPPVELEDLRSAEVRRHALENRADILGALAEYAAWQSALQLEIAKQYPDIHLGPGYQYDQNEQKLSLMLTAELPVFHQNQGPIAEAEARRTEAATRFYSVQAKALSEIDRALAAYRVAQANAATLDEMAVSQKRRHDQVQAQVRAGAGDQLDLLNAEIELGAGQLVQLNGQVKLHQSYAALEDAVQSPLQAPARKIIEQSPRASSPLQDQP